MRSNMSKVISMSDYARAGGEIRPKMETRQYLGQRYVLQFDPHAPPDERWHWTVKYTETFEFRGSMPTIEKAAKAAMKRIRELVRDA
jgi:hypothetical protein